MNKCLDTMTMSRASGPLKRTTANVLQPVSKAGCDETLHRHMLSTVTEFVNDWHDPQYESSFQRYILVIVCKIGQHQIFAHCSLKWRQQGILVQSSCGGTCTLIRIIRLPCLLVPHGLRPRLPFVFFTLDLTSSTKGCLNYSLTPIFGCKQ